MWCRKRDGTLCVLCRFRENLRATKILVKWGVGDKIKKCRRQRKTRKKNDPLSSCKKKKLNKKWRGTKKISACCGADIETEKKKCLGWRKVEIEMFAEWREVDEWLNEASRDLITLNNPT